MVNEILDAPEEKKENKYSRRAFWIFLAVLILFLFLTAMGIYTALNANPNNDGQNFSFLLVTIGILTLAFLLLPFIGLFFSIVSFKKREKGAMKWIGFVGNSLFSLVIGMILYANFLDILRGFS